MTRQSNVENGLDLELAKGRRNPYLADYRGSRSVRQVPRNRRRRNAKRRAQIRRRKQLILVVGIFCVLLFVGRLVVRAFDKPDVDGSVAPKESGVDALANIWPEKKIQGTSAAQNRSYFEQLKDTQERSASAHFIIGYEGEIIQCVPLDEIAYAVQTRNEDSISIECCYVAEDGSFTKETYDSLILLLQWLIDTYDLDAEDILRHYDCGGKKCPIYYTEHEDAWEQLKEDVKTL